MEWHRLQDETHLSPTEVLQRGFHLRLVCSACVIWEGHGPLLSLSLLSLSMLHNAKCKTAWQALKVSFLSC